MPEKPLQGLYFITAILLLGVTFTFAYTNSILSEAFYSYWIFTYIIFGILIYVKLRQGIIYHPIVLVGCSYFLLLIAGSIVYEFFKGRVLHLYAYNLIGIGFSSLMAGTIIGELLGPKQNELKTKSTVHNAGLVYTLSVIALLASMVMFIKFKGLPILSADPNEAKVNFLSGNGVLNLFFKGISVLSLALLYERFHNGKSLTVAHIYCAIVMVVTLAAGYRSSSLVSLGEYIALYVILTKVKVPLKQITLIGLLAILFLASWGAFRRGSNGMEGLVNEFDMVINGRPVIMEAIVRNFEEDDFFNGSLYYSDFKRFQPGVQVNANVDLKYAIFPTADSMPESAGITPSIVGEAYMNFGQKGVYWVLLIAGLLLGYSYQGFKSKPNFLRTAIFLTFVFGIADAIQTGIGLKLVHLTQFWIWAILLSIILETRFLPHLKLKQ